MNRPQEALGELEDAARPLRDSDEGIGGVVRQPRRSATPGKPPPDPIGTSINRSYFVLRRWISVLAIALPLALWIGDGPWPHPSISEYYHNPGGWLRDAFVGTLCAIGFFLYFYRGYSTVEDVVLNVAGAAAVLVAFAPMEWCCGSGQPRLLPAQLHYIAAVTLFLAMGYTCVFESGRTLALLKDERARTWYQRAYNLLGTLMVGVPVAIWIIHLVSREMEQSRVIFAIETAGIWIFAVFWLVKSREIARIQGQS